MILKSLITKILFLLTILVTGQNKTICFPDLGLRGKYGAGVIEVHDGIKTSEIPLYDLVAYPLKGLIEHKGKIYGHSAQEISCHSDLYKRFKGYLFVADSIDKPAKRFNKYEQGGGTLNTYYFGTYTTNFSISEDIMVICYATTNKRSLDIISLVNDSVIKEIPLAYNQFPDGGEPLIINNCIYYTVRSTASSGSEDSTYVMEYNIALGTNMPILKEASVNLGAQRGKLIFENQKLYGLFVNKDFFSNQANFVGISIPTGQYQHLFEFNTDTIFNPNGQFTKVNGKYVDIATSGGSGDKGAIYQFNPATESIEHIVSFAAVPNGNPFGNLVKFNNKIYGLLAYKNQSRVTSLFELDTATFDVSVIREYPHQNEINYEITGSFVYQNKLLLYGPESGTNHHGQYLEIDFQNNQDRPIDPFMTLNLSGENVSVFKKYSNKLYTINGCITDNSLISFNLETEKIESEVVFNNIVKTENFYSFGPFTIENNILYGTATKNLDNNIIFSYNLDSREYQELVTGEFDVWSHEINKNGTDIYLGETHINLDSKTITPCVVEDACYRRQLPKMAFSNNLAYTHAHLNTSSSACANLTPYSYLGIFSSTDTSILRCEGFLPDHNIFINQILSNETDIYVFHSTLDTLLPSGIYKIEPKTGIILANYELPDSLFFASGYYAINNENIFSFARNRDLSAPRFLTTMDLATGQFSYEPIGGNCQHFLETIWIIDEDATNSITKNNLADELVVFPNPSNGIVRIQTKRLQHLSNIEVYDSYGKKVLAVKNHNEFIELTNLYSGIYTLKIIYQDASTSTKKIVLTK